MMIALFGALLATTDAPRVQVTRREVTVTFPRGVAPRDGWTVPAAPASGWTQYGWWVTEPTDSRSNFDGRDTFVAFEVRLDSTPRRSFSSLEAVVAQVRQSRCFGGMLRLCFPTTWRVVAHDRQVVLRLTDSVMIDSVFGLRPRTLRLSRHVPPDTAWSMDVAIEYRDPQLPMPDRASIAAAPRAPENRETVRHENWLDGGDFWIALGDSQEVTLYGSACTSEGCGEGSSMGPGTFTVRNSRIAALRPRAKYTRLARLHGAIEARTAEAPVQLFAIARGVTTVVYQEYESPGPDATGAKRSARRLEQTIHVTSPLRGIRIMPRPARVPARRPLSFSVVAIDREGRTHPGVPPEFDAIASPQHTVGPGGSVIFYEPGPAILIAKFRSFVDTLRLVVDSKEKPYGSIPASSDAPRERLRRNPS